MFNIIFDRYDSNFIGDLELEVTMSEEHNYKNQTSDYPVEAGATISDHVRQFPETVTISGIFSETPLPFRAGRVSPFIKGVGESNMAKSFESLLSIAGRVLPKQEKVLGVKERNLDETVNVATPEQTGEPKLVDLVTGLRIYTNMICTSLTFPRGADTGRSLRYSMSFKKFYTVSSRIVEIDRSDELNGKAPGIKSKSQKTKPAGKQSTKVPKSTVKAIFDAGREFFFGGK